MTSLRDRFFTPKVAEAIMSPAGIVMAGAGAAIGVATGLPLLVAAGIGVAAWGARVLAAVGVGGDGAASHRRLGDLADPWRGYVQEAVDAKKRFDHVVADVAPGPLRDRLAGLSGRLDDGVDESWRIARRGDEIVAAINTINTEAAQRELSDLRRAIGSRPPTEAETDTIAALDAQLASAKRLGELATRSRDRLRLLDARFDELVARTVEVSVGGGDTEGLGDDVDGLVNELEALRIAMEETDRAARGGLSGGRPVTG
ncbi:MAG: hypothetical protein ACK5OX_04790 [Desertimonas sp.]